MANGTANPTMARLGLSQFFALLLHARKTLALTAAVLGDMRVHWFSKAMYISGIGAVLLALVAEIAARKRHLPRCMPAVLPRWPELLSWGKLDH